MRFLVLVILCWSALHSPGLAQVRFNPEKVEREFAGCSSDTTFEVYLVNESQETVSDFLSKAGGMTILEFPQGWELDSVESLEPGDSVRFLLKHSTPVGGTSDKFYADIEFKSVYFTSRATRHYPRLIIEPSVLRLADVPLRTTFSDTVVITNPGNAPRTIDLPKFDSLGWRLIGADTITLEPGEQVKLEFEYTPRSGSAVTLGYRLDDQCINSFITLEGTTRNTNLVWLQDRVIDTIVGCGEPTEHTLKYFHTDSITPLLLDSIGFVGDPGEWTFVSEPPRNLIVQPGDTLSVTMMRQASDRAVDLAIFTSQACGDTVSLSLSARVPNPQFIFVEDTVTIDLQFGETIEDLSFELKNHGAGEVRFRALEQTGDTRWTIDPIDTNLVLSRNDRMKVHTRFAGASEYGVYPMTFTLVADRCDLRLSRTVIARILDPNADVEETSTSEIRIYPSVATNSFTIAAPVGSEIRIVDGLGNEVYRSKQSYAVEHIVTTAMTAGAYFVEISTDVGIKIQSLRIVR